MQRSWIYLYKLIPGGWHISMGQLKKYTVKLLKLGIAQTMIQALAGCTGFFVNQSLMLYTTLQYVAVWNVVQKIYMVLLMPIVGITQGIQTILAYFSGHREEHKKKKTMRITIGYTVCYGIAALMLVFFFGKNIISLLINAEYICQWGSKIFYIVFSTFPLMGIFYTITTLYEVTGHEGKAVFLILTRQVFLMIPLTNLLPKIFPTLSCAVFCAVPIADLTVVLIALFSGGRKRKTHEEEME